ncbi:MAG: replicative DNA helicase [Flavobacteriales bacterium]|nr:replicative DNA helicase [Flavobacteriales bacterium]MBL6873389.1 replicative DNA helicase [Flavobacteriales bacterium]
MEKKKAKISKPVLSSPDGKLPPQAIELEQAVLGALMIDNDALSNSIELLKPESFYQTEHQKIFSAIEDLFNNTQPVDILTVTNLLKQKGDLKDVGGAAFVSKLTERVASAANIETHARIIAQKFIQRELIRISSSTIRDAYDDTTDVFDLLNAAEQGLFEISEGNIRKNYDKMSTLIRQALEQIEEIKNKEDGLSGIPSGFSDLDRVTSGWQKSDLVILAARPGMGKTAFVLSMARNTAVQFNKPVAVFSLEMSSVQLVNRLISSESGIPAEKLRKGNLEDHEWIQLNQQISSLSEAPLFIDDTPALTVFELRAKCRRLVRNNGVEMVIIDYLQLMHAGNSNKSGNREQEISTISRSLKSIAKELNIPIIALSQLSRAVETRGGDKRPMLSDLRESGAIEQDADIVCFIYRPDYYGFTEWPDTSPGQDPDCQGQGEIIIAKHRNGSLENIRLRFISHLAKFTDLDAFGFSNDDVMPSSMNNDAPF